MEWHWDPDAQDCTFELSFLLVRENGEVRSHHESHTMVS